MSSGLYSGVSGMALGTALYRDVTSLWSGATSLVTGFGTPTPTPPSSGFAVLASGGSSYAVSYDVLSSAGSTYTVGSTVLDSAGGSYSPV